MPSCIVSPPSGFSCQVVISGASIYSGSLEPVGGIQFYANPANSGNLYIAFSGLSPLLSGAFMTINSGTYAASGGCLSGMLDGQPLAPGAGYFAPSLALTNKATLSGLYNVFATCDVAASGGFARLHFEIF